MDNKEMANFTRAMRAVVEDHRGMTTILVGNSTKTKDVPQAANSSTNALTVGRGRIVCWTVPNCI